MKKKTLLIIITIFVIFCFVVLLKGLSNSNTYVPDTKVGKQLLSFKAKKLFNNEEVISDELFFENKIYLLNLWASWCVPCRTEHHILMQLSNNPSVRIIGLNYKDNLINAKKFINQMGNPYSEILIDNDGTISIELGAFGIPETFIIDKNKIILKKFVGPINDKFLKEIESLLK